MEDNTTLEYFLSLLDEGERILTSDYMGEKHTIVEYELKDSEVKKTSESKEDDITPSSCRGCAAWAGRVCYVPPKEESRCNVMCILPSPSGTRLLSPAGEDYFKKWFKAIGIDSEDVALTTLVKCPCSSFNSSYADACKGYLKSEMVNVKPRCFILFGEDVARYMLRKNGTIDTLRGKRYIVNNTPTFVTYSPEDLVKNISIKPLIWEDLQFIKGAI